MEQVGRLQRLTSLDLSMVFNATGAPQAEGLGLGLTLTLTLTNLVLQHRTASCPGNYG